MNVIFGVMAAVPVILKLTGVVDWSWITILTPIFAPLVILGLMYLFAAIFTKKKLPKKKKNDG